MNKQSMVREFHQKFGLTIHNKPSVPIDADVWLRTKLIKEEWQEFHDARNLVEIADALGDLLYVVYGAGVCYGIEMDEVFAEVHRSNLTKLWTEAERAGYKLTDLTFTRMVDTSPDGRVYLAKNSDGKVIKSPSYSRAEIEIVLRKQGLVE